MGHLYAYTPYIWPSFITVLLLLAQYVYVWPRRNEPGAWTFAISILFGVFWAAGSVFEYAAADAAGKIFWVKFQAVWQLPATTAITCFFLEYTWPGRWLTRRNLALLSIAPLLSVIWIVTNDLHHRFWLEFNANGFVHPVLGPAAWFGVAYAFGLGLLNLLVLTWLFLRSPQHRWPAAVMIAGQIGMRSLYLLEKTVLRTDLPLDILGIAFVDLMYTTALFGFRIFDPIPLARQAVIEQMQAGMFVLDAHSRVTSLNPCAERIVGASARQVKGQFIRDVLPAYPGGSFAGPEEIEIEHDVPGNSARQYTLTISPLRDFRGLE
ncbi:MAG TPA: histidine kinase N-terminal 7TM domain-containing protein, partial [Anaerolineaceae bacterium]|nr:histidine kinase N-terminal 7TM domain-containing protein [Anaerolineaceae bacterium]